MTSRIAKETVVESTGIEGLLSTGLFSFIEVVRSCAVVIGYEEAKRERHAIVSGFKRGKARRHDGCEGVSDRHPADFAELIELRLVRFQNVEADVFTFGGCHSGRVSHSVAECR